ncbi:trans-1,2-dihydrobenzene-1,2-diol dehydrogenase-like [Paramacrobiotus metropolitanus]|uniref:trans-1,2-dihydrobenzene-1,2-diol dehydrogenase-like n=1 Tax=Paramacrobiotus metropolitanus TaxID=2943436 RepID=UPI00244637B2|nr:trans-1,2-dihydrobenzene-1,2-diol dehydrogenase-like [Paramacrobiotus metropolitanus]
MLNNNKHVLCEKPLTLHLDDTQQLIELARKQGKYLMEGIWSRCFPAYKQLKEELAQQTIGEVRLLTCNYGFARRSVPNLTERDMGGGILFNVGCYAVQLANLVFGSEKPVSVKASALFNSTGADDTTAVILQYASGAMAQFMVSMSMKLDSTAKIVGTTGEMELPGTFIAPTELRVNQQTRLFPLPAADPRFKTNYTNSVGLAYQAEEARQCILSGQIENPWMTFEDSSRSAQLMERICKETGLKYD